MDFYEYTGNLHNHTIYSDGALEHRTIAQAAIKAKLNFVITTDHNIRVRGVEGYYGTPESGYALLLVGEEVYDRSCIPTQNHCLVYGVAQEMASQAHDPQQLFNSIRSAGGLSFIAHPFDKPLRWHKHSVAPVWKDWSMRGFTGMEVWNFMSTFKTHATSPVTTVRYSFHPEELVKQPDPAVLACWDKLLAEGRKVVGIGGADGHGMTLRLGPFANPIFAHDFLFSCISTHILTPTPLAGDASHDAALIYHALEHGRAFISYDLVGDSRGFRYTAQGGKSGHRIIMGGSIRLQSGVTLQALGPRRAHFKIIRHGDVLHEERDVENLTYVAREPGAYRVEVWDGDRCWILSNPIYVEPNIASVARDTLTYPAVK